MRRLLCMLALASCFLPASALAELCTIDDRPSATLLLPYFMVDLDNPGGLSTLFSINNASSDARLAHVTVWSDWSIPIFDFDLYLSGYDVQTFNLRDLIAGILPQTGLGATVGVAQPGTGEGAYSNPNAAFPGCNDSASPGGGPYYEIPAFGAVFRSHVEAALTGAESPLFAGACYGSDRGNNIAIGYITVDTVNQCSLLFPADHDAGAGLLYFGPTGVATDDNDLWGDFFVIDSDSDHAQGSSLVHIEADQVFESQVSPSSEGITFYGRYVDGIVGLDHREPLPTTVIGRHCVGPPFTGVDVAAWRSSEADTSSPVACGARPSWFPLNTREIYVFDESENPFLPDIDQCVSGDPTCDPEETSPFPNEVNILAVGSSNLPIPPGWEFGFLYMNMNHDRPGNIYGDRAQTWVVHTISAEGRFSVGFPALQVDNACQPNDFVLDPANAAF